MDWAKELQEHSKPIVELGLMRRTLGLNDKGEILEMISHFVAFPDTKEYNLCQGLVEEKLMEEIGSGSTMVIFGLTDKGKKFVLSNTPKSEAS